MRIIKTLAACALCAAAILAAADAQEGFGFGAEAEPEDAAAPSGFGLASGPRIGGSLEIGGILFFDELDDIGSVSLGELYSARLSIDAAGSKVDALLKLKASRAIIEERPAEIIDEARLRLFVGGVSIEGGLMKLSWGKADSQGPLDVLNPLDLRDLSVTDSMERKIARPMLRAAFAIGQATKAEAVFLPGFEGYRIATEGRWRPAQFDQLEAQLDYLVFLGAPATLDATYDSLASALETSSLAHSQAGARMTTSLGPVDLGFQYFYGYLPTPAVKFSGGALPTSVELGYDRYHQVGADFAAVVAGFNTRAELAANLTEDLEGDDPGVYNPSLAFSLGFDRDLFAGVNLNLQYAGSYRLKDDAIDRSATSFDIEKGTGALSSALTCVLMKSLFKDALSLKLSGIYEFDDEDFLVMPSAAYALGDAEIELSAGIFGGDEGGQMGQYADSSYLRLVIGYSF